MAEYSPCISRIASTCIRVGKVSRGVEFAEAAVSDQSLIRRDGLRVAAVGTSRSVDEDASLIIQTASRSIRCVRALDLLRLALGVTIAVSAMSVAAAQEPAPGFEVASIKRVVGEEPAGGSGGPTHFYRPAISLRYLLVFAFDLPDFRVIGGPAWIEDIEWEVSARTAAPATLHGMRLSVQGLLAERFALKTHIETRRLPIYELKLVRSDGRLGPNIKPAAIDCRTFLDGWRPMQESPRTEQGLPRCAAGASFGSGEITPTLNGVPIGELADYLSMTLRRSVLDKTGLEGVFDVGLTHRTDGMFSFLPERPADAGPETAGAVPSLFTALSEQLGLKLESARGPVDVLVIDAVQQPTEN